MKISANNPLEYGAKNEAYFEAIVEDLCYERISTFYSDLSIAEWYGEDSIKDTYKNVCKNWIHDYKMFTEFIMCLNYKSWQWVNENNNISRLYADLYNLAYDKALEYFKDNKTATTYIWQTLD